jgi:hypothetical protein
MWCRQNQKYTRDGLKIMMERQSVPREEVKKPWEYVSTLPPDQAIAAAGAAGNRAPMGKKQATDKELDNLLFNPQALGDAQSHLPAKPAAATPPPAASEPKK